MQWQYAWKWPQLKEVSVNTDDINGRGNKTPSPAKDYADHEIAKLMVKIIKASSIYTRPSIDQFSLESYLLYIYTSTLQERGSQNYYYFLATCDRPQKPLAS